MTNDVEKLALLKTLTEKGRMVVDTTHAPLVRTLISEGLVEKWGIPDMMIHKPTPKGWALIAEINTPQSETDSPSANDDLDRDEKDGEPAKQGTSK